MYNITNISNSVPVCLQLNHTISAQHKNTIVILFYIFTTLMSCLSVVGAAIVIRSCWILKNATANGRHMLMYLSISDLVLALSNISGIVWELSITETNIDFRDRILRGHEDDDFCKVQAGITSTASIASFIWTTFIALNIFLSIRLDISVLTGRLYLLPHLISWGVPLCVLLIAALSDVYGLNPCTEIMWWCWIKTGGKIDANSTSLIIWQLITGKLWEISAYILVVVLYGAVKGHITSQVRRLKQSYGQANYRQHLARNRSLSDAYQSANKKLIFVPLVFIAARIWGTFRFLLDLSDNSTAKLIAAWLAPLQGIGDSAQGFLNCVVFVATTKKLRDQVPFLRSKSTSSERHPVSNFESSSSEAGASQAVDYGSCRSPEIQPTLVSNS